MVKMGKNSFVRLVAMSCVLKAMLICSSKDTTTNMAAAIEANTCFSLWWLTLLLHGPSGLFMVQTDKLSGKMMGIITTASSKSLRVGQISATPHKIF